jgi:hypothetical protein
MRIFYIHEALPHHVFEYVPPQVSLNDPIEWLLSRPEITYVVVEEQS